MHTRLVSGTIKWTLIPETENKERQLYNTVGSGYSDYACSVHTVIAKVQRQVIYEQN